MSPYRETECSAGSYRQRPWRPVGRRRHTVFARFAPRCGNERRQHMPALPLKDQYSAFITSSGNRGQLFCGRWDILPLHSADLCDDQRLAGGQVFMAGAAPSLAAIVTRSASEPASIFRITWPLCAFTVISLMPSS
jgi:hypothetical protein